MSRPFLCHHHEAARQDCRETLPDSIRLESDLRRLLAAWETQRRVRRIPARQKRHARPAIDSEKLYGRARGSILARSFHHVVANWHAGIGTGFGICRYRKVFRFNELHKVLFHPAAFLQSGSSTVQTRHPLYTTLAQAFQSLVRLLLSKSEAELRSWATPLREA